MLDFFEGVTGLLGQEPPGCNHPFSGSITRNFTDLNSVSCIELSVDCYGLDHIF